MSSLTIDQLKRSLTEQGIALPPSNAKKAEYLKLYEQHNTLNESLGDTYSSDDENSPRGGSQNVTSSSSPSKTDLSGEVERLSDDELYSRLVEFGVNIGPVLTNTRRVYEKKLIKLLSSGWQSNGIDTVNSHIEANSKNDEFSDSDVEVLATKVTKKKIEAKEKSRSSVSRKESPKPSLQDVDSKHEKSSSGTEFISKGSVKQYGAESRASKISFIETIPKGSSHRYIERSPDTAFQSGSNIRSRHSVDKSSFGTGEHYTGTWEPNVSRYTMGTSYQGKSVGKGNVSQTSFGKRITGGFVLLGALLLALYLYVQWSATDPYKLIEDDAEQKIKQFAAQSSEKN